MEVEESSWNFDLPVWVRNVGNDFWDSFEVINCYGDNEALADGLLKPFVVREIDTGHRITTNAYETLVNHYRQKGYETYSPEDFMRFFYSELLPLVPAALEKWSKDSVLQTDYDFKVVHKWRDHDLLWYEPNGNHERAVTIMKPEDH